jgi:hypothetical protein
MGGKYKMNIPEPSMMVAGITMPNLELLCIYVVVGEFMLKKYSCVPRVFS